MNVVVLLRLSYEKGDEGKIPLLWAKNIKDKYGGSIIVMSMDGVKNVELYRKCFSYGVDRVIILNDRDFSGADVLATSRTIGNAIDKLGIKYDLILASSCSSFGETGQVPISVANYLGVQYGYNVTKFKLIKGNCIVMEEDLECYYQKTIMRLPVLLSLSNKRNNHNLPIFNPTLFDVVGGISKIVEIYSRDDIQLSRKLCGTIGSYTRVIKCERIKKKGEHLIIKRDDFQGIKQIENYIKNAREDGENFNNI